MIDDDQEHAKLDLPNEIGSLTDVAVNDIQEKFVVPDYQRGYRWGQEEVEHLLNDIVDCTEQRYYLQPIVVRKSETGSDWELIDGQQRLTTLYLIKHRLAARGHADSEPAFKIRYATRERSEVYLRNLGEPSWRELAAEESESCTDFHHMFRASEAIEAWLSARPAVVEDLNDALRAKVRLLRYDAPSTLSGEELFRRLNSGRILLTDSELVKAMLVALLESKSPFAAQWDSFEQDLRNRQLWAFVAGSPTAGTHIDLLLDAVADLHDAAPVGQRPPFQTFSTLRSVVYNTDVAADVAAQSLWDEVVRMHSRVLGWFDDQDLYHHIGYLLSTQSATFTDLAKLASSVTATEFRQAVARLVAKSIPKKWDYLLALSYENSSQRKTQERALLLMNVEATRSTRRQRFPFEDHQAGGKRVWSLEHIHPQRSRPLGEAAREPWLKMHAAAIRAREPHEGDGELLAEMEDPRLVLGRAFEDLQTRVLSRLQDDSIDVDSIQTVSNLALLDRNHNSALGNSAFDVKRRNLMTMDQSGEYIPICTRNAFLNYYTTHTDGPTHYWSDKDQEGYLAAMKNLLYGQEES